MYKETDENGQYQLDCRRSSERSLEENTNIMIDFAHDIVKAQKPGVVKNRHEGYGILAEAMCVLNLQTKAVGDGMKNFLTNLSSDDDIRAIERAESISNALADTIVAAVTMAAWAKRIGDDLYEGAGSFRTPLEEYAEKMDEDGFSEPENEEE